MHAVRIDDLAAIDRGDFSWLRFVPDALTEWSTTRDSVPPMLR